MADEELKSMILSFRISELHMLLSFAGRNKVGRKVDLQARAIELLQLGSYPVILKIRNLYKSLQQSISSGTPGNGVLGALAAEANSTEVSFSKDVDDATGNMQQPGRGYPPPNYPSQQNTLSAQRSAALYAASIYHHQYQAQPKQTVQAHSSQYPIHPDVKLKKLPFYEIIAELVKPSSLVPQGNQRQQESTFVFHLTPQQANAVGMSRDMRSVSKMEYTTQVQLRFCLLETTSEQDDCFPPGVMLKVNGKMCQLPNPIPTNKPGVEPKRPPRPVNITLHLKISPTVANNVQVQWSTDYTRGYVVAVYLVNKKTSEDLLNRLKNKLRGADYTRGMIKDKLNEDADSEIATTSLRVSLICPLGKMRMVTPCRASTCHHLQCFDASLYLQMNERKPTWMCPVCDKPAIYDRLVIDGYFYDVLISGKLPQDGNEIQLHSDGSWSSLVVKKEQSRVFDQSETTPMKQEPKVEILDIEPDVIATLPSSSEGTAAPQKKKEEVVDLTISDSDDEPLMPPRKKQHADSTLNPQHIKYTESSSVSMPNRPNSVSSSGQHSPSLIILDSDTPPNTPTPTPQPRLAPPTYVTSSGYLNPAPHYLDVDADSIGFPTF